MPLWVVRAVDRAAGQGVVIGVHRAVLRGQDDIGVHRHREGALVVALVPAEEVVLLLGGIGKLRLGEVVRRVLLNVDVVHAGNILAVLVHEGDDPEVIRDDVCEGRRNGDVGRRHREGDATVGARDRNRRAIGVGDRHGSNLIAFARGQVQRHGFARSGRGFIRAHGAVGNAGGNGDGVVGSLCVKNDGGSRLTSKNASIVYTVDCYKP